MKKTFIATCLLCFYFVSIAQVSEPKKYKSPDELFDISLEEMLNVGIISASKSKQGVQDAPATGYVFTQEDLRVRGYTNLADLLEDVPEVELQRNASPQFRNVATVRGISGNEKLLILMNGIRITPATGDGYSLSTNLSLTGAERVEVIIGPASALYGVDAFAGIINIITNESDKDEFASFSTEYGNYNSLNHNIQAYAKKDNLSVSVTGNFYTSDEPNYASLNPETYKWYNSNRQFDTFIVPESPYYNDLYDIRAFETAAGDSFNGGPLSLDFGMPSQSHFFSTEISYKDFSIGVITHQDRHSMSYGVDPKYTLYDAGAQIRTSTTSIYAKHTFTSFDQKWGINSTITLNNAQINEGSHAINAFSRWQRGYFYAQSQSSKIEEQVNYNFSRKLSVIGGFSFELLNALPQTGSSPTPFEPEQAAAFQNFYYIGAAGYQPNGDGTFYENLIVEQEFFYIRYYNMGSYGQLLYEPNQNLSITAGVRYDFNSRFKESINPRLGIVYATTNKAHRFKFLYGESFLAPSPYKTYLQRGSFWNYNEEEGVLQSDYFRIPNPDLRPEKLRTAELSYQVYLLKNLSLTVGGYYNYLTNLINLNAEAPNSDLTANIDAPRIETSLNGGQAIIYGITGRLNSLSRIGSFTIKAQASISTATGEREIEEFGNPDLVTAPILNYADLQYKGVVDFLYNNAFVSVKMHGRTASTSSMRDKIYDIYFESPAYTVVNASLGYQILQKKAIDWRVYSRLNNLTNLTYYHNYIGQDDGMSQVPQDPFRYYIGTELRWKF